MIDPRKIDGATAELLNRLPPAVAERVAQKYEDDRQEFIKWLDSVMPSKEARYWAKRSCTKCHGCGILGTLTTPSGEKVVPACACTEKSYRKWIAAQRLVYNVLKEQGHETTTNQSTNDSQALNHDGQEARSTYADSGRDGYWHA